MEEQAPAARREPNVSEKCFMEKDATAQKRYADADARPSWRSRTRGADADEAGLDGA